MPRVLVVDDDPLVRGLLVRCLHNAGYDTAESPDGSHAIVRLERENGFDVLVTDYSMPGATGLDVIRVAQRVDPTLPAIVVTAFHDMDLAMQAMEAGAVGFLPKPFRPRHLEVVVAHALERRRLAEQTLRLRLMAPMLDRFTMVLANVIEAKDASTHSHCERLVAHADAISMRLGIDNETRANVRLGACLHDVGKIGIPEDLLRTSRSLSETEFEVVREHSVIGAKVLANIDGWEPVRAIVRHHHERFEGGGYPDGLAGAEIPLGARIVAVADSFDVIRSGRAYRPPRSLAEAVAELRTGRGHQFDPDCIDAFLDALSSSADDSVEASGRATPVPSLLLELDV